MKLYPWQSGLFGSVMRMRDRMPHALLLQGRAGVGKYDFSMALAESLLCENPASDLSSCGICQSCNWFAQGNHPDFRLVEPEDAAPEAGDEPSSDGKASKKSQISVDQVRQLSDFLGLSSHRSGLRLALIHPAEALNQSSANALLKMLEEPPADVVFLLVSHQPQRLLPTILSRCSKIDMPLPPRSDALAWLGAQQVAHPEGRLAYVGGAPLLALEQEDGADKRLEEMHMHLAKADRMDPFAAASVCAKDGMGSGVDILQKWLYDLASLRMAGRVRYHVGRAASLQAMVKQVDLPKLLDFQRTLVEARRLSQHSLNAELQLESLMIQYTQIFAKPLYRE